MKSAPRDEGEPAAERPFTRMVSWSHRLLADVLSPGDLALDLTAGTGRDTLFLFHRLGPRGRILAFDIQREALLRTESLLAGREPGSFSEVRPSPGRLFPRGSTLFTTATVKFPATWRNHRGELSPISAFSPAATRGKDPDRIDPGGPEAIPRPSRPRRPHGRYGLYGASRRNGGGRRRRGPLRPSSVARLAGSQAPAAQSSGGAISGGRGKAPWPENISLRLTNPSVSDNKFDGVAKRPPYGVYGVFSGPRPT